MVVKPIGEVNNGDSIGDPSPTTITVVQILPDASTPTPSPSTTLQSNSLTSISLKSTTTVTKTEIGSSPSRTPTPSTSTSSTTSRSLASSVSSSSSSTLSPPIKSSEAPLSQNNKTLSPASSLNSGAIAGIVLACLFALLVGTFFAVRTWSKRKRASKRSRIWSRSMFGKRYDIDAPDLSYEAKLVSGNGNSRGFPLAGQTSSQVSAPPISYNNDAEFQYSTTPVTSSPSVFISPVYSPGLMALSPYSTTVVCTFIPSLPDELTISVGETLRVLAGYEDGWSLCMDCQGKQGMVPNECLEKSFSSMGLLPPNDDYRISRSSARVSSLAQAVRHGR